MKKPLFYSPSHYLHLAAPTELSIVNTTRPASNTVHFFATEYAKENVDVLPTGVELAGIHILINHFQFKALFHMLNER